MGLQTTNDQLEMGQRMMEEHAQCGYGCRVEAWVECPRRLVENMGGQSGGSLFREVGGWEKTDVRPPRVSRRQELRGTTI